MPSRARSAMSRQQSPERAFTHTYSAPLRHRGVIPIRAQGPDQSGQTPLIPRLLLTHGVPVAQPLRHRGLHGAGNDLPDLFAVGRHPGDQRIVAGDERGPIPGHIRLLAQRIQHQHAVCAPLAHLRVQRARRHPALAGTPVQHRIAFVGQHHRADLARGRHDLIQPFARQRLPRGVARRIDPHGLHVRHGTPRLHVGDVIDLQHRGAGQLRADLIRRVGDARLHHHVARPQPQQRRHQRHRLLGADRRHDTGVDRPQVNATAVTEPVDDRLAQIRRAGRCGIPVRVRIVRGGGQRAAHRQRHRIDRGSRPTDQSCRRERMPRCACTRRYATNRMVTRTRRTPITLLR